MNKDKKTDSLTLRITPKMKLQLIQLSLIEERTMSDLATEAIEIYLSNRKDVIKCFTTQSQTI